VAAIPALGVVLAGGRGLRMNGQDKGLLPWQGRPLAAWVLEAMRPQFERLAINANRNMARYAELGVAVFTDENPSAFDGPLAGIQASLRYALAHDLAWVCVAPCDAAGYPPGLAAALWAQRGSAAAVLPRTPDGHWQPGHALISTDLLPALNACLAQPGNRRTGEWLLAQGAVPLAWHQELPNFNTPEALQARR
jgi:molybdopterin-guanine dinucleotide biosynthesis protein A